MAMTMADSVIRKACDRCHTQKLSCRRVGDEACERCVRLKTECKYSPSLRYKKQQHPPQQQHQAHHPQKQPPFPPQQDQQHHHQQPLQQHRHQGPGAETSRRSPKRRRTESDPSLVPPETVPIIASQAGELARNSLADVTPDAILELGNFNFNFDQLGFFTQQSHTQGNEHLSHPGIPNGSNGHQDSWDHRLLSSSAFQEVAPITFPQTDNNLPHHTFSSVPFRKKDGTPTHEDPGKHRRRAKQRPRQITLRHSTIESQQPREAPSGHWMAELSEINASLLDLTSALPQHATARSLGRPSDERFNYHGFPIDEMFQLTRRVADILDQLSAASLGENSPIPRQQSLNTDPGSSMFILSTYVRLLDMYQRVFSLVRKELSQTNSDAAFQFWKLPDVTVGSFAVESSPSLQMSLTVQVAEEFLSRLRRSTSTLAASSGNASARGAGDSSMFLGVVDVSFQAVKTREESLSRHLAELRGEIEALLDS